MRRRVHSLDVDGYLASIERCRDLFPDLRILSGIEAGEPHHFAGSVAAVLRSGTFDRVLGSLHSIVRDGRLVYANDVFGSMPAADLVRDYFAELLRLVEGSDVFQVLAHCDYPRRYWPARDGEYREADFEEEYRTVFRALAASDRPLELNTASPLASATLMRWWYDGGRPRGVVRQRRARSAARSATSSTWRSTSSRRRASAPAVTSTTSGAADHSPIVD